MTADAYVDPPAATSMRLGDDRGSAERHLEQGACPSCRQFRRCAEMATSYPIWMVQPPWVSVGKAAPCTSQC